MTNPLLLLLLTHPLYSGARAQRAVRAPVLSAESEKGVIVSSEPWCETCDSKLGVGQCPQCHFYFENPPPMSKRRSVAKKKVSVKVTHIFILILHFSVDGGISYSDLLSRCSG